MKHFSLFVLTASVAVVAVAALPLNADQSGRYFIAGENAVFARAIVAVQHEFDDGFTADLSPGQLQALEVLTSRYGVTIEPVPQYRVLGKWSGSRRTAYPTDQTPWGIEKVYNNPGVTATGGGAGVDVAVLDTGVDKSHIDLKNRVKQCLDFTRGGVRSGCKDFYGHGTHVAGTIAADAGSDRKGIYGVAPQTNLFAYKVCGNDGFCWTDNIAKAIRYAADHGAEIISMSLGGDAPSSLLNDAVDYAVGKNVLVVAAAGNDGPVDGSIDYPGAYVKVVAVGAIDAAEAVADWSSRGINDGDYVVEEREVEFGAPGVSIESTYPGGRYALYSGTSMATPHVSGLAAKFWQGNGAATRAYLQGLARDIWTVGDDTATGFGLPYAH